MKLCFFIDSVAFTKQVISGETSLGGSESACLGLARALRARGHQVHVLATKLDAECHGPDHSGVMWHPADVVYDLSQIMEWDAFVSLRMPYVFQKPIKARTRLLWNQDLLIGDQAKHGVMSVAWAYDHVVYVSEYHRKQWEGILPELKPLGWVTKNGYDPQYVPTDTVRDPNRIIHISRPERGLRPLLEMWPALRQQRPDAELQICRYSSMYDPQGWARICNSFDQMVQMVNQQVGGITYLGELGKPALYRAISEAAVMWYPGVVDFAETSCVAAIEAQACGTPFVGSWKGALPETVPSGVLLTGDASSREYQIASVSAVVEMLDGCKRNARHYRELQQEGREHVKAYTYDVIAAEWEAQIEHWFTERSSSQAYGDAVPSIGVLRQLLHHDDHTAALELCEAIFDRDKMVADAAFHEAEAAEEFCQRVIRGEDQTAEQYAEHAITDPLFELKSNSRFAEVIPWFAGRRRVLDVACGNGSFAIGLALQYPDIQVVGIDYAQGNIDRARKAAEASGVADRVRFACAAIWDFTTATMNQTWSAGLAETEGGEYGFDGVFCGEFLEHVSDAAGLVDGIELAAERGALVVFTMPNGPFGEMLERGMPVHKGHVHHFTQDDIYAVFGQKQNLQADYLTMGMTPRGSLVGHWLVRYQVSEKPAQRRDYQATVTRTRPKTKLSVGMIVKNAGADLARCLESVWPIADEILIGDTGCTDNTRDIAAQFGARVIEIDPVDVDPDGFAGARNKVLDACTGDWHLMIDADEVLVGGQNLWKYLEGGPFVGYSIHQVHLMVDGAKEVDKPVRLFRRRSDIRYYGCIHEQPQMGDCNTDISPALEIGDVAIAHTGYLTEQVRREKMFRRNLPLLIKDQERFPDRVLGQLLVLRDLVNLGDHVRSEAGGTLVREARQYYGQAIGLFEEHFQDPAHKFYGLARPFYETAIKALSSAMEFEIAIAGRQQGMGNGKAKPERIWVRDVADVERVIAHHMSAIKKQLQPTPTDVEPIIVRKEVAA